MKIDWLIIKKNLEGVASPEKEKEYRRWLSEDCSHRDYIEKIQENYHNIEDFKDVTTQQVEEQLSNFKIRIVGAKRRRLIKFSVSIAASLVLFLGISSVYYYNNRSVEIASGDVAHLTNEQPTMVKSEECAVTLSTSDGATYMIDKDNVADTPITQNVKLKVQEINYSESTVDKIEQHTLTTPRGKNWNVVLADGTKVFLNADSELQFPSAFVSGEPRVVALRGEGYFEVAKDKKSQFIVKTEELAIKVYGTKFNVNCHRKGIIETVLVEGAISVTADYNKIETMIKPNQQAMFVIGDKKIIVNDVNANEYILWKDGILLFNEITIAEIMDRLMLLYDYDIQYLNDKVKGKSAYCKVPRTEGIEPILDALSRSGVIMDFEIKGRIIYIK